MPRAIRVPSLCHHKASGKAVVRLSGVDHYLGAFGSPEAKAAYDRLIAEWLAAGRKPLHEAAVATRARTVDEVLLAFWTHAQTYYRHPDGTPTSELKEFRLSLRPVHQTYGTTPAAEFGPKALAAVRAQMVAADTSRNVVNRRVGRIVRAFKWAAAEEIVPVTTFEALRALAGLRKGRTEARESEPIKPVPAEHVEAALPFLDAHLAAMVRVQRCTGMRPGEVCAMRFADIDRTGEVWVYRPARHKTAHHGRDRAVPIGPRARAVLVEFLLRSGAPPEGFAHVRLNDPDERAARLVMADAYQEAGRERDAELLREEGRIVCAVAGCVVAPDEPIFSPARAREERFARLRAARKSKVQPSQKSRRSGKPKRAPGSVFQPTAYAHAVARAARLAGVPHWHPNQLRHLFATEVRKAHGLEASQVLLGHAKADVTQVYAERDLALALRVAADVG